MINLSRYESKVHIIGERLKRVVCKIESLQTKEKTEHGVGHCLQAIVANYFSCVRPSKVSSGILARRLMLRYSFFKRDKWLDSLSSIGYC